MAVKTRIIFEAMTRQERSDSDYGLAFETSSAIGRIALGRGDEILGACRLDAPRAHAMQFLPAIAAICNEHDIGPGDIGTVYVSCGPGSFTGLRISVTTARMMAMAGGARLVAVPTLEVIAQNALDLPESHTQPTPTPASGNGLDHAHAGLPSRVVVVLDAKRSRVYACGFVRRGDRYSPDGDPIEADPAEFLSEQSKLDPTCAVLGEGVLYHRAAIEAVGLPILPERSHLPRAETVYRLGLAMARRGLFSDRRALIPVYVRPPEAEEKWRLQHIGLDS